MSIRELNDRTIQEIEFNQIQDRLVDENLFQEKIGRSVYKLDSTYVKIWESDSIVADSTQAGIESGYYDENTCSCFAKLVKNDGKNVGYILHEGKRCIISKPKDWNYFKQITTFEQRFDFFYSYICNSINSNGCNIDLWPCNLVLYNDKISLIDIDSYRSFEYIFHGKNAYFEKFIKNRNYLERYLNKCIPSYLENCLDIELVRPISNIDDIVEIKKMLESRKFSS